MPHKNPPHGEGWKRWLAVILMVTAGMASAPFAWANPAHDRLAAMSEVNRSEALSMLVESSGQPCRTVARTFFQGEDDKGNVFWNVECSGGHSYVVQIKNDVPGSTRVLTCSRLEAASGERCFKKFK